MFQLSKACVFLCFYSICMGGRSHVSFFFIKRFDVIIEQVSTLIEPIYTERYGNDKKDLQNKFLNKAIVTKLKRRQERLINLYNSLSA